MNDNWTSTGYGKIPIEIGNEVALVFASSTLHHSSRVQLDVFLSMGVQVGPVERLCEMGPIVQTGFPFEPFIMLKLFQMETVQIGGLEAGDVHSTV